MDDDMPTGWWLVPVFAGMFLIWFLMGLFYQTDVSVFGVPVVSETFLWWLAMAGGLFTLAFCLLLAGVGRCLSALSLPTSVAPGLLLATLALVLAYAGVALTSYLIETYPERDDWAARGFASYRDYKDWILNERKISRRAGFTTMALALVVVYGALIGGALIRFVRQFAAFGNTPRRKS